MISPLEEFKNKELEAKGIKLFIKRDDLVQGPCQGNKFRKLKYHLAEFKHQGLPRILTFGGAFSNHIFATAAAGYKLNIETIGIIRGEIDEENPTIQKVRSWGMHLHPVSRKIYQQKENPDFITQLKKNYPDVYIVPEGGHHPLAQIGTGELVTEVRSQYDQKIDYWVCPFGTGSTTLGIIKKIKSTEKMLAYLVLKGFDISETIKTLTAQENILAENFILREAHFGGYGKQNKSIEDFIIQFYERHRILLDPIYLGKMFFQLWSDIRSGLVRPESTIIAVHTGGLQGLAGYNYRYGTKLPEWEIPEF